MNHPIFAFGTIFVNEHRHQCSHILCVKLQRLAVRTVGTVRIYQCWNTTQKKSIHFTPFHKDVMRAYRNGIRLSNQHDLVTQFSSPKATHKGKTPATRCAAGAPFSIRNCYQFSSSLARLCKPIFCRYFQLEYLSIYWTNT